MTTTLAVAAVIALAFASWAIWRWRVRVYVDAREIPPPPKREVCACFAKERAVCEARPDLRPSYCQLGPAPRLAPRELCLSCGQPKAIDQACPTCGFCGIVTVEDSPNPRSRLVQGSPAGANEAKDSSRRRWG